MKRSLGWAVCLVMLTAATAFAQEEVWYGGLHPVNPAAGGGFCSTSTPHPHPYGIDSNISYLFRNFNNQYHFVGNPYLFGYQGQAFSYYGHHPIPEYNSHCYLDGAHHHQFLPSAAYAANYLVNGGSYYYNGTFPPFYYSYRSSFYRTRHTFWYQPAYRTHYTNYGNLSRRYATPASIGYIHRPPRITYQYSRPPTMVRPVVTVTRPVYRYNTHQPAAYQSHYRPQTVVRPVTTYVRPTTTYVRPSAPTYRPAAPSRTWRSR
jgi:hypothetical protein